MAGQPHFDFNSLIPKVTRMNASDALGPAWEHTRRYLFDPRSWRLLLKIGFVACFAEMGGCNNRFNTPGTGIPHGSSAAYLTGFLIGAGVVLLVLGLGLFYLSSRLQFVLFDLVLRRDSRVAPSWRQFGALTWRWIGFKLIGLLAMLLCMLPVALPLVLTFVRVFKRKTDGDGLPPEFGAVMLLIFTSVVLTILFAVVYSVVRDFAVPVMALENLGIAATYRRVWTLVRAQPGQVLLYLFLKVLCGLAGGIACYLALLLVAVVLAIPLGGAAFGLWTGLHAGANEAHAVMYTGWVLLGLMAFAGLFCAAVMSFGVLFVFLQAYTLYFLSGGYPALMAVLRPQPVYVYTPPPPLPPRGEDRDDGGPSLPMDPALA